MKVLKVYQLHDGLVVGFFLNFLIKLYTSS